jgi:alanine racemase
MSSGGTIERASARIDAAALRHNATLLAAAAGSARLMAVVKADGYGHGDITAARSALEGGATALAVATVAEAERLRRDGLGAPILVMGPLAASEWSRAHSAQAEVCVWTPEGIRSAVEAVVPGVHLKLDTGMGRLGARPEALADLVAAASTAGAPVVGLMTHFATADEREGENASFMREQLLRFRAAVRDLRPQFPDAFVHAANSAATLREPDAHFDMVRCGIALYGCCPFGGDPATIGLRPAMSIISRIASLKVVRSRDSVGYGRTWRAARGAVIGLVPVGYADGYSRALSNRAEVLVAGRRVPVVGTISMDQLTVDLGPESHEAVGDEVVLLGASGGQRITAEDIAGWRSTINYEVTCGFGPRIPRIAT